MSSRTIQPASTKGLVTRSTPVNSPIVSAFIRDAFHFFSRGISSQLFSTANTVAKEEKSSKGSPTFSTPQCSCQHRLQAMRYLCGGVRLGGRNCLCQTSADCQECENRKGSRHTADRTTTSEHYRCQHRRQGQRSTITKSGDPKIRPGPIPFRTTSGLSPSSGDDRECTNHECAGSDILRQSLHYPQETFCRYHDL